MKIGIFGGTFDPIHHGHLIIAEFIRSNYPLDRILFLPSSEPPHKIGQPVTLFKHRFKMVKLAIQGHPFFDCSDLEQNWKGPSYSVEIIRQIKLRLSDNDHLYFIIGGDSLRDLHTWHQPEILLSMIPVIAVGRPGVDLITANPEWLNQVHQIKAPMIEILSSELRESIRQHHSIRYQVPDSVLNYIEQEGLYL